jgi:hypothetical protein
MSQNNFRKLIPFDRFQISACFCPESLKGTGRFFPFNYLELREKREKIMYLSGSVSVTIYK